MEIVSTSEARASSPQVATVACWVAIKDVAISDFKKYELIANRLRGSYTLRLYPLPDSFQLQCFCAASSVAEAASELVSVALRDDALRARMLQRVDPDSSSLVDQALRSLGKV